VAFQAERQLWDYARAEDGRPWCLTVSFTHPHDPYVARRRFWDLYEDCAHLDPEVPAIPYDQQDAHSKRIFDANDWRSYEITPEMIRRARRAYFANISYLDEKIGGILDVLERGRMAENTVILFVSDHGDMLGERGLWFKMSFFEGSSRVPMMMAGPGIAPARIDAPVSTVDVCPTLADLAGVSMEEVAPWTDGESLLSVAKGAERTAPVAIEYAAEASYAPMVSLRYGRWKYNRCALDPDQLFDLEADPQELTNLADVPEHQGTLAMLRAKSEARWDLAAYDAEVRESQARRWVVYEALRKGAYYPWDFQPLRAASEQYMRNHMDLNVVDGGKRFPKGE